MCSKMATNTASRVSDGLNDTFVKEVIQEGSGLHKPNEGATCKVLITPASPLPDAEGIIGYPINTECEICLGTGTGSWSFAFDSCIESMRLGEQCRLTFDAKIITSPDGTEWVCIVYLIGFSRSKDISEMTSEEKLIRVSMLKDLGTKCFKEDRIEQAELFYLRGLKYVITIGEQKDNRQKLLLSLNIAACQLKQKHYDGVIIHCTKALNIDSNSTKALFRRGQAFVELQDYELAQSDFDKCLQLEPNNKAVQNQVILLSAKRKKLDAHYAHTMSKMFGKSTAEKH
ncbi:peptidyl-prolyl cis-trans isomerase FKBP4-like [Amphiura filiformis]|uniref:peptidyl-prolyl cis-trans isomerase FKBP4-like n=1 Tax=Amphiura filiformis TaxID=82378 RepID=UPI003B217504